MSEQPLTPSEVREKVLAQHREIEQMLTELEQGVAQLQHGVERAARVKRAAYAMRGILELHMTYEEKHLVPAISGADGFGPERALHILNEHQEQRRKLDDIVSSILAAVSPEEIAQGIEQLATALREDMQEEECNYVNALLLHDHLVPTDAFGR